MPNIQNRLRHFGLLCVASTCGACVVSGPVDAQAGKGTPAELSVTASQTTVITVDLDKIIRPKLPDTLFGFNIRWNNFESDLWNATRSEVYPNVITALMPFTGAMYRYPGGTVANSYDWEEAQQPLDTRRTLNNQRERVSAAPLFGINEYYSFVSQIKGTPFYTVNLLGREQGKEINEYPSAQLASSNRRLAENIKLRLKPLGIPRLYQLGNELDRGSTEWPHDKYVSRALDTMKAMGEADPDARFIAFVREFNWKYRQPNRPGSDGMSRYDDFIRDVLVGLPKVNDLSLNIYYDGTLREGGKFLSIDEVMTKFGKVLSVAEGVRPGKNIKLWVTEHSRRIGGEDESPAKGRNKSLASGLGGALSSADFLIGLAQIPAVEGASWHALNGVDRQLFEPGVEPKPTAVYWALRVLRIAPTAAVVSTRTASPNISRYQGGYDVRAAALSNGKDGPLSIWAMNRASRATASTVRVPAWKGKKVTLQHYFVAGSAGVSADQVGAAYVRELEPKKVSAQFDGEGVLKVELPPSSISTLIITPV